jgi:hypothetical protein
MSLYFEQQLSWVFKKEKTVHMEAQYIFKKEFSQTLLSSNEEEIRHGWVQLAQSQEGVEYANDMEVLL